MASTYQSGYSKQDINNMVPAPRPQEVLNSIFVPTGKPIYLPHREGKRQSLQTGSSSRNPITISGSGSPSPFLRPSLHISTRSLFQSDFPPASDRSNNSYIPQDDHSRINASQPHGHLISGSRAVDRDANLHELEHNKAGLPQIEEASKRLQQIMGLRNEEPFQPPMAMRSGQEVVSVGSAVDFNPALRHLRSSNTGLGIQIGQAGSGRGPGHGRTNWEVAEENQRGTVERTLQSQQRRVVEKPLTLRESLLLHGRQPYGNQVKTELRSLTFHDLTPDMRSGCFKNEMLAHFEADQGGRTRLMSYHVDVPVSEHQRPIYSSNGVPLVRTERWISFLISTPFVTFKAGVQPSLPPNLPSPDGHAPSSWLVFAAPERAIISHLPSKDNIISQNASGVEVLRPVARYDYDFSHNGIPAFEFMDKSSIIGDALSSCLENAVTGPFLCGKGVAAYEGGGEDFILRPREKNEKSKSKAVAPSGPAPTVAEEKGEGNADDDGGEEEEEEEEEEDADALASEDTRRWDDVENWEQEMGNSWWWNDAQAKFLEDRRTWTRIKDSMARGCCRVVVRVEEGAQRHRQHQHQPQNQNQSQNQSQIQDRHQSQDQPRNQSQTRDRHRQQQEQQGQHQQPQRQQPQWDQDQDQHRQQQQQREFQDSWTTRRRRRMGGTTMGGAEQQ